MINLDQKFQEYLYEPLTGLSTRLDKIYDLDTEINAIKTQEQRVRLIVKLLERAYKQGCRDMAQDTIDTLGDYSTATAGVEQPKFNPEQAFEHAQTNLMTYYTKVLDVI